MMPLPPQFQLFSGHRQNQNQYIGICRFNYTKLIQSETSLPISGFISLSLKSTHKIYDLEYPVSLNPRTIRFYPDLLTLSDDKPLEILIDVAKEYQLEKINLLPFHIPIAFTKEVMWNDGYNSLLLIKYDRENTQLPAGIRFGILSFQFSNGKEVKKNFIVKDTVIKSDQGKDLEKGGQK